MLFTVILYSEEHIPFNASFQSMVSQVFADLKNAITTSKRFALAIDLV